MRISQWIQLMSLFLSLSPSNANNLIGQKLEESNNNIIKLRRRHTSTYQTQTANKILPHVQDPLKDLFRPRDFHLEPSLECKFNQEGYYGIPRGDIYNIEFLYQIHVLPDTRPSALRVLILPALDATLTSSLLPDFFDCEQGSPLTTIQAIDWHPVDLLVESGLTCDPELTLQNLVCFVVQGFMSVHAVGSNERIVSQRVLSSVQSNIENLTTPVIRKVDYIGTDLFDLVPSLYEDTIDVPMPPPIPRPPSSTLYPTRIPETAEPSVGSEPSPTISSVPTFTMPTPPSTTTTAPAALLVPTSLPVVSTPNPTSTLVVSTTSPSVSISMMPSVTVPPTSSNKTPTIEPTVSVTLNRTTVPSASNSIIPTRSIETEESSRGIETIEWWGWLLLVFGVVVFLLLTLVFIRLNEFYSERKLRSVRPESSSSTGGVLTKLEQARQEYIPPGLKVSHGLIPSNR
ncbi:hypothetical protein FisN_20Lh036 [Fistulifera solaris]|uniref:SEA domain-containing protein n=1 Tax=Fistulifera solaris TaxID=1519565 RepID=A0A1Z5JW62_FISSO|nr:hypothetical protein FisN_20Lh036 [Fistulifera solaris]|eukprot:GAX18275.1 hypothetical protein FisN_20Lh036 [Fistulifera solaris]